MIINGNEWTCSWNSSTLYDTRWGKSPKNCEKSQEILFSVQGFFQMRQLTMIWIKSSKSFLHSNEGYNHARRQNMGKVKTFCSGVKVQKPWWSIHLIFLKSHNGSEVYVIENSKIVRHSEQFSCLILFFWSRRYNFSWHTKFPLLWP